MYAQEKNEVKVRVAARQQTVNDNTLLLGAVLVLVISSVIVLIGRSAGGM